MIDLLGSELYKLHHGDCIEHLADMPEQSIDFSIYSPPFPTLYAYGSKESDIGNSEDLENESKLHLSWFFRGMRRVIKPGRAMIVHCANIPRMKRSGGQGLYDFHGMLIRLVERAGFSWEYSWSIRKNPQSQAIRTHSHELQFAGLENDRSRSRGALPDYLLKFTAPGENAVKVDTANEVTRNQWIDWAEHCWSDIIETDTLNTKEAKGPDDVRHICPLQLEVIRRCVLLFSNPGEIVFSPFAGIGSEGFMSIGGASPKTGKRISNPRRFYGIELKDEYYRTALKNLNKASKQAASLVNELLPMFRTA